MRVNQGDQNDPFLRVQIARSCLSRGTNHFESNSKLIVSRVTGSSVDYQLKMIRLRLIMSFSDAFWNIPGNNIKSFLQPCWTD